MEEIHIIFDGPPSHESGRFVEVEDGHGKSINTGEWRERPDGLWALVIPCEMFTPSAALDSAIAKMEYIAHGTKSGFGQVAEDAVKVLRSLALPAGAARQQAEALQAVVDAAGQIDVWQLREFAERRSMNNYSLGKSLRDGMPGPIRALHDALNRLKSERGNAA